MLCPRSTILSALLMSLGATAGCGAPQDATQPPKRDQNVTTTGPELAPPVARIAEHKAVLHGDTRIDNYHWLREKDAPDVLEHLRAEEAYAIAMMKPTEPVQGRLYDEIVARIKETDLSVPVREGDYFYYSRTEEGKQYTIYCRKRGSLDAEEEVILDVNELAKGHSFMAIGTFNVSNDGRYLAYSVDTTGFRDYTLQVKDLTTGKLGPEKREKVKAVAWASDNQTVFYAIDDDAKRPHRIYRHKLGADHDKDELIYEEKDERFRVSVWQSRSKEYIFVASFSLTASEYRYLPAGKPGGKLAVIVPRNDDHEYFVEHRGKEFFIRTNDVGRNFRMVRVNISNPSQERWQEVIPHREDVMLEGIDVFRDFYVTSERQAGLPHLRVTHFGKGGKSGRIPMEEPVYELYSGDNPEFAANNYRYRYTSPTTPTRVFDFDVDAKTSKLLKETEVLGDFDRSRYQVERLFATANDGTSVPLSVFYRKGSRDAGPAPLLLVGYGSYGFPYPVTFSHARISLLDRGAIIAIAHIRGGGELGKKWHDDGRMMNKKNTFTDFIAAADHLVSAGYTTPQKLIATGGSAGGLLMGAVANMRPELFHAIISHVPFVDVLNTMLDESLPLTVGEFEEWGNPKEKEAYFYMKSYCPYTNIEKKAYPTMLVKTSYNDSQVMYWEPAKYVAKLRALKTDKKPLLFKINMDGGHGGSSGRYDRIKETAFDYAFMLREWNLLAE